MAKTWRCGDCGTKYPKTVHHCTRYFDDYVSLRGGSIETAIARAVEKSIAPVVRRAEVRLSGRIRKSAGPSSYRWTWTAWSTDA